MNLVSRYKHTVKGEPAPVMKTEQLSMSHLAASDDLPAAGGPVSITLKGCRLWPSMYCCTTVSRCAISPSAYCRMGGVSRGEHVIGRCTNMCSIPYRYKLIASAAKACQKLCREPLLIAAQICCASTTQPRLLLQSSLTSSWHVDHGCTFGLVPLRCSIACTEEQ